MQTTQQGTTFAIGDELPTFQRESGFAYWNRYAAVNDEFVPIHMDDAEGQASGYPTAFGMGNLTWAYLHAAVRDWMGESAHLVRISTQFRAAITRNNRVSVRGRVAAVANDGPRTLMELDIWAEDAAGTRLAPGTASVALTE